MTNTTEPDEWEPPMHTYAVNYVGDCAESKYPCDLAGRPHDHAYVAVLVPDEDAAAAAMLERHPGATVTSIVREL